MLVAEHIAVLKREGELFADAIGRADPNAPVPTCPEWTVRELAHHMGRTHRWAAAVVREARPEQPTSDDEERIWGTMPADDALDLWVREGHRLIVDALTSAPADLSCWAFLAAPSPLAFWARRQAHETAIHRVDAQTVLGQPDAVEVPFATDGVDELLLCFFAGRSRRLRNDEPVTLGIAATDAGASWVVHIGPEGQRSERVAAVGPVDCLLRGPAVQLYYGLWNRRGLAEIVADGDPAVVDIWRQRAMVRWS